MLGMRRGWEGSELEKNGKIMKYCPCLQGAVVSWRRQIYSNIQQTYVQNSTINGASALRQART